jgi:hypothetical protein
VRFAGSVAGEEGDLLVKEGGIVLVVGGGIVDFI